MRSKHGQRSIKSIAVRSNGAVFDVTFSNNWFEIIRQNEQPRRWAAVQRLIEGGAFSKFGGAYGSDYVLTPAPIVSEVPSLAESFADAAMQGFKELDPSSVSYFETAAAYAEFEAFQGGYNMTRHMGNIRRAILYRWYARSLISGKPDRAAILAAYEGLEL